MDEPEPRIMLERARRAVGFIKPCLPSPAKAPPSGPDWLHEVKHDGFRVLTRRDAKAALHPQCHDFSAHFPQVVGPKRFPLVVAAIAALPVRSCLIDGEATSATRPGSRCSS